MVQRYMESHPQVSVASAIVDAMVTENRELLPQKNLLNFT